MKICCEKYDNKSCGNDNASFPNGLYFNINGKNLMIYQNQVPEYVTWHFGPSGCSGGSYEFSFDCNENFVTLTICLFLYFSRYSLYLFHGLCIMSLSFFINCNLKNCIFIKYPKHWVSIISVICIGAISHSPVFLFVAPFSQD